MTLNSKTNIISLQFFSLLLIIPLKNIQIHGVVNLMGDNYSLICTKVGPIEVQGTFNINAFV